jgi:large subunit ribosomal protein L9
MRLLLRQKIAGLGSPGDVVEIRDGYGRNYLLPQRLAVPNTPENRAGIENDRLHYLQREADRLEKAKEMGKGLKNALLQIHMKAQKDGTLYGSVGPGVVAEVVKNSRGYEIEERWVTLATPIKKIGDYDITLQLPSETTVTFKLTVLPEDEKA